MEESAPNRLQMYHSVYVMTEYCRESSLHMTNIRIDYLRIGPSDCIFQTELEKRMIPTIDEYHLTHQIYPVKLKY